MLSQTQVSRMLDVGLSTLSHYVAACASELSPSHRRSRGRSFTEADVAVLRRIQGRMAQPHELRVYCAWCGKQIGVHHGAGVSGSSHGMCQRCADRFVSQYELESTPAAG